jgi:murein DD-endopeptidase MepM/ murein hydrolase activator NlpD
MKNEGKIEIGVQSKEISPTTSKEAYEFRQLVKQAGFVELDAVTQAEIGWFLPQGFNGEQLTTALNLYSLGVHSEKLEQRIDKSEELLANLSERERQSLYAIPYLVAAFEEYDPERSSQLQTAHTPSITIQQVPSTAVSQDNRFVFERLEGYFSPVMKQVAGKGIGLAKKKVKDFAVKAIEKGGKKLIKKAFKKGAGLAFKAGAKAAITAGAQAIGTTVPVLGNIVAFIVTEVIPRLIKGATKLFSAFLRAVTGEKDFRKQLRNLAAFVFVFALALGQPVLAGVAGFTAVSAQAAILGSQGISAGIAGAGQTFIYGLYAVAAPAIGIPILLALLVTPFVIAFIVFIINSGAYITPHAPRVSPAGLAQSAYIGIEKTAELSGPFDNSDLPLTIDYTITVTAKLGSLSNIVFDWNCTVISDTGQTCPAFGNVTVNGESVPNSLPPAAPSFISPVDSYEITYTMLYRRGSFEDTLTIDTFSVTADVAGVVVGEQAAASATSSIGDPPDNCPNGWPATGGLSQGANGPFTHQNAEAIDIFNASGPPVTARHSGIVRAFEDIGPYGRHVEIVSECNGEFFSRYGHLETVSVRSGDFVNMGQVVGRMGNTGNSYGVHVHYEFRDSSGRKNYPNDPPYMMVPYVPKDLPRNCTTYAGCGSVNIP